MTIRMITTTADAERPLRAQLLSHGCDEPVTRSKVPILLRTGPGEQHFVQADCRGWCRCGSVVDTHPAVGDDALTTDVLSGRGRWCGQVGDEGWIGCISRRYGHRTGR